MTEVFSEEDYLAHYGVLRRSGRYPYGSGGDPYQGNKTFLSEVDSLRKQGMTEKQIADGFGISTTQLRASRTIAKNAVRAANASQAVRLQEKGLSNVAIGERMGLNESSVRSLLNPANKDKRDALTNTSEMLKEQVSEKGFIDVGTAAGAHIGVADTKLNTAVAMLREEGYTLHYLKVEQLGTGQQTTVKVLAPPETAYSDVFNNRDKIRQVQDYTEDGGLSYEKFQTPVNVSSKRVGITYAEDGGASADGVIYVRPGVDEFDLGGSRYAQVRIAVDGTHYLKGMAMYKDDLPDGVDLVFNTNKTKDTPALGPKDNTVLKGLKDDPDLPFGSVVRQRHYVDSAGNQKLSAMNIVNEEGTWDTWSKTLSSQMLSKQSPTLAKNQLAMTYDQKLLEYDEIMGLTNPVIRKKLLESYADDVDSSSVHLKAAALPRQRTQVILPVNSLTDNEIYAPQFRNGERVVLVRYPHGGIFEIPELTVNNRNREANSVMKQAKDAVGINARVAERLSGADFDGDTVLVIPNSGRRIKTSPSLAGLQNFDPKTQYKKYDGMPVMSERSLQQKMGDISNLITDMTIHGASQAELARAVRHSMVVIDAVKHELDHKGSYRDNGIPALKEKYQGRNPETGRLRGASTLISQAKSDIRVPERKPRPASEGGPIDPRTGQKVYVETGTQYTDQKGRVQFRTIKSKKLAETSDAFALSSGTEIEDIYATHSNRLKGLANRARKSALEVPSSTYSPSARKTYSAEVASLDAKLNIAIKNRPRERQAQLIANAVVSEKRSSNPGLEKADLKKIQGQALTEARIRTGAKKQQIEITPSEWTAIQAGAVSNKKLGDILDNTDLNQVKKLATPRTTVSVTAPKMARAQSMLTAGYTQAEIADALGIPTSTLNDALHR